MRLLLPQLGGQLMMMLLVLQLQLLLVDQLGQEGLGSLVCTGQLPDVQVLPCDGSA